MADVAKQIWDARRSGAVLPRDVVSGISTRAEAYDVQAEITEISGKTQVGWKIAATSELAQELLDVPGPSLGPIYMDDVFDSGVSLRAVEAQAMAVECEFAFVMGESLVKGAELSRRDIVSATEMAMIAIEVVGSRFEGGFKGIGELRCICDCSMQSAFVHGAAIDNWFDISLIAAEASLLVNGKVANQGTGAAVMGDPIDALCWAVEEASKIGMPLNSGDIISTGTMTGATLVKPGDHVVGDFGSLGTVEINF